MRRYLLIPSIIVALAGPAEAKKTITSDTTWGSSTVALDEDTSLAKGATLTIKPGTKVSMAAGVTLTIEGTLVARGTAASPITFTGKVTSGTPARWKSIVMADSSTDATYKELDEFVSGSILEHCVLEYGTQALKLVGASPHVSKCTFRNNVYKVGTGDKRCGAALLITKGSAPRVVGCTFKDNSGDSTAEGGAIFAEKSAPIIQDCTFTGNKSAYGGAVTTYNTYSPMVGNTFEKNIATWEGGAVSLLSSSQAFLNNTVKGNSAAADGGGVHVCVTCYPHATPFFFDNTFTGNTNTLFIGAAGFGAAYLRAFAYNNVYGNTRMGVASDFSWHNELKEGYPAWVSAPKIANNWWGTTDTAKIDATIADGNDSAKVGKVDYKPVLTAAVTKPETRVTITTEKLNYKQAGEAMPVYLTLYNPGARRDVELLIMISYEGGPPVAYRGKLDFPGAKKAGARWQLTLPANGAYFTKLMAPAYAKTAGLEEGAWHAALFEAKTGKRVGDVSSIRFQLGGAK